MIYDFFLALFALAQAPKIFWQQAIRKKRFSTFGERFGKNPPAGAGKKIWIHAVSVGEVKAAKPLVRLLRQNEPSACILITATTAPGLDEAKRSLPEANLFRFMPLDFSWIMRRWIRTFAPSLLLFIEGDLWPNLIREAKRAGVKTALASGKISERSVKRFRNLPFLAKRLFGFLDVLCVQNEEHRSRFASIIDRPIAVTGNLKLDLEPAPVNLTLMQSRFALAPGQIAVTLSCTHAPEEKELLDSLIELPEVVFFLAPRHPERFEEAAAILRKMEIPFCRWEEKREGKRVVLVDAMGQLPHCYAVSSLAIVGGSFSSRIGGHNVLEPLLYGCPVLFGPHMEKQREFARLAIASGAGWQIAQENLPRVLLEKISMGEELRKKARLAGSRERGAAERSWNEIKSKMKEVFL